MTWDRVCQNCHFLSFVFKIDPIDCVLGIIPLLLVVYFLDFVKSSYSSSISSLLGSKEGRRRPFVVLLQCYVHLRWVLLVGSSFTMKELPTWGSYSFHLNGMTKLIQQFKSDHLSSRVTLDDANIQEVLVRVYVILKSGSVAFSVFHNPVIKNLKRIELLRVRNHVVASEAKKELLRQFLEMKDPKKQILLKDDMPISRLSISRCRKSAVHLFEIFQSREYLSLLSQTGISFHFLLSIWMNSLERYLIHETRLFLGLRRRSFLNSKQRVPTK